MRIGCVLGAGGMWLAVLAAPVLAEAPGKSLRPHARPVLETPQPLARPVLEVPQPLVRPAVTAPPAGVVPGARPDSPVAESSAPAGGAVVAAPETPAGDAGQVAAPMAVGLPMVGQLALPSAPPPALRAARPVVPPAAMAEKPAVLPQIRRLALSSAPPPALRGAAGRGAAVVAERPAALPQIAPLALPAAPPPALRAPAGDRNWLAVPSPALRPQAREDLRQAGPQPPQPDPAFAQSAPPPARATASAEGWQRAADPDLRPKPRPDAPRVAAPEPSLAARFVAALRPEPRPAGLMRKARPAAQPENLEPVAAIIRPAPGPGPVTGKRGSVCGVPTIRGETISPIVGRVGGCGVAQPVRITAVAGVALTQPSVVDCDTARALHAWVDRALKPAFGGTGGGVTALQIAGHYVCRTRNHKKGARLSEHSKGKAIDISAIILANGQKLTILRDYRGRGGAPIRAAHKAACGIFGTTLGPGSDGMHEDHLHFDTARHRNGAYCR